MKNYIDSKTRIKTGFLFRALGHAIFLQKKVGHIWITKAWTYPHIFDNRSYKDVVKHLLWKESDASDRKNGVRLMNEGKLTQPCKESNTN